MRKIEICLVCLEKNPPLTLRLVKPSPMHEDAIPVPDTRVYEVICLSCGSSLVSVETDNTLLGIKRIRDEMDTLYGKSETSTLYGKSYYIRKRNN